MRIATILIFIASFSHLLGQTKEYTNEILFNYKSSSLTAKNIKQIRSIWEILPLNASVELLLVSDKEIKKLKPESLVPLSKARADAVNLFLTSQKVVSSYDIELNTHSFTESESIHGSNSSFKRIVRNPYKVYSVILSKEVPICYNYTDAERRALNSKKPFMISINANENEMIKGPEGVLILIPANSFNLPLEKKSTEVTIKLWEFLSTEDMVLAGLNTMSSGRLIETGGMIYITADYEGICLKLLRSAKITVKFPTYAKLDSMWLFKGIPLPNEIDWVKTNNPNKVNTLTNPDAIPDMEGEASISYYVLESSGLGWINCDRFSDITQKIDVAFTFKENFNIIAGLIFTEINSIMPGNLIHAKNNNVVFHSVPKGKEAILLIYAISIDKKKVYYATQKVILGDLPTEEIKLSEGTLPEFKLMLTNLKK